MLRCTGAYLSILPAKVQGMLATNPGLEFHEIPPSYWLSMSDGSVVVEDFDPSKPEQAVIEYVLDELDLPIVPPNLWNAVGDVTTTYCRFVAGPLDSYICTMFFLCRHGNIVGALHKENARGDHRLSVDSCPCSE